MKKLVILLVLILLVVVGWVGATYYAGVTIEKRYQAFIDKNGHFGPVSLANRTYQRGLFSSRVETLVKLTAAVPTGKPGEKPALQSVEMVLTHNVFHGPVIIGANPGGKKLALAVIDTGITIPGEKNPIDEMLQEIPELRNSSSRATIAMNGNVEGRITIPAFSKEDDGVVVDWGGFELAVNYSPGPGTLNGRMDMPSLKVQPTEKNDKSMSWAGAHASFDLVEALPMLFVGKSQMVFGPMTMDGLDKKNGAKSLAEFKGFNIETESRYDGRLVHFSESVSSDGFSFDGEFVGPLAFEIELKNMNAQAMSDLQQKVIEVYRRADPNNPEALLTDLLPVYGDLAMKSMAESPELNFNRLYVNTPMGEANGTVKIKYDHPQKEAPASMVMLPQYLPFFNAVADVAVDRRLVKFFMKDSARSGLKAAIAQGRQPQMSELEMEAMVNRKIEEQLQAFEAQGFVARDGTMLKSLVTLAEGQLQVNGKPMPLFGGQ